MTTSPAAAISRPSTVRIVADGAVGNNAVTVQMLALCPMLAVSVSISAAAVLGALTAVVMAAAGFLIADDSRRNPPRRAAADFFGCCRGAGGGAGHFAGGAGF